MDTVALILLVAPTLILALKRIREAGLAVNLLSAGSLLSALGLALLAGAVFLTFSSGAEGLLESEFLPARTLMFYLISGMAFGMAIFPSQAIELSEMPLKLQELRIAWLLVPLAWLWIAILFLLAF